MAKLLQKHVPSPTSVHIIDTCPRDTQVPFERHPLLISGLAGQDSQDWHSRYPDDLVSIARSLYQHHLLALRPPC